MLKFLRNIFFVLLLLELVSRVYLFGKIPEANKLHGFDAVRIFVSSGSYLAEFRNRKYLFNKPGDVYRILAIGGSTTIGHVLDHEPWPAILEDKLNQGSSDFKYEVINLGWWGAWSAQEQLYLLQHMYLQPDFIIIYDGYNDMASSNADPLRYIQITKKVHEQIENGSRKDDFQFFMYRHSALVNRLHVYGYRFLANLNRFIADHRIFGIDKQIKFAPLQTVEWWKIQSDEDVEVRDSDFYFDIEQLKSSEDNAQRILAKQYEYNLTHIRDLIERNKIKGLFIFQPYLPEKEVRLNGGMPSAPLPDMPLNLALESYITLGLNAPIWKAAAQRATDDNHVYFFDATTIFDESDNSSVYMDMCHYTRLGDERVADAILKRLSPIL